MASAVTVDEVTHGCFVGTSSCFWRGWNRCYSCTGKVQDLKVDIIAPINNGELFFVKSFIGNVKKSERNKNTFL